MGLVTFAEETRSVISDIGNIGNVDFANDTSLYTYDLENDGPVVISVPFPLLEGKPQFAVMGKTIYTPITIENTSSDAVRLWSVEIYDSKPKDSFTLSVMEPPSLDSDENYIKSFVESFSMDDRILLPHRTLTIWLSCKAMVKGLHATAVHFNVNDDKIERMGFIMAEDKVSQSLSTSYIRPLRVIPKLVPPNEVHKHPIKGLNRNNYVAYFKNLLTIEEIKLQDEIKTYDMQNVTLKTKGGFLTAEVPGLSERIPSLITRYVVYVKHLSHNNGKKGHIFHVGAEEFLVSFLLRNHLEGDRYDVQFEYNRLCIRRLYQAIEASANLDTEFLFPDFYSHERRIETRPFIPISSNLNEEQLTSVKMILGCKGGPPYVVHGPPGTGKSAILTEAILQLYKTRNNSVILVCTGSNSAADHLLAKLVTYMRKGDILKLSSTFRRHQVVRRRIIISTYANAALLCASDLRTGHFTHMFLDDAAKVSEPETMIPISHFYRRGTVVVLSGDPIYFCKDYGLGKSFMERLCESKFYKDGNKNYVTKLVRNYRSHKHILSHVLYKGELVACKEEDTLYPQTWKDLVPNPDFPVLFIGVQGVDESEGDGPTSWFNRIEASEVVDVILSLKCKGIKRGDIGVITPYRQQAVKVREALDTFVGWGSGSEIKVGTVESFEGEEREVVVVSTVRSTVKHDEEDKRHCLGFLGDPRRFNVAISRARSLLIVVGNPHILCKDEHWNKLLWNCVDNDSYKGCFLPGDRRSQKLKLE